MARNSRHARETPNAASEHALRRLDIHEFPAHEQTQHRPSKGLGECLTSCSGSSTKVPSARNPPSVTSRCKCGCQFAREPWVWIDATTPTDSAFTEAFHATLRRECLSQHRFVSLALPPGYRRLPHDNCRRKRCRHVSPLKIQIDDLNDQARIYAAREVQCVRAAQSPHTARRDQELY